MPDLLALLILNTLATFVSRSECAAFRSCPPGARLFCLLAWCLGLQFFRLVGSGARLVPACFACLTNVWVCRLFGLWAMVTAWCSLALLSCLVSASAIFSRNGPYPPQPTQYCQYHRIHHFIQFHTRPAERRPPRSRPTAGKIMKSNFDVPEKLC